MSKFPLYRGRKDSIGERYHFDNGEIRQSWDDAMVFFSKPSTPSVQNENLIEARAKNVSKGVVRKLAYDYHHGGHKIKNLPYGYYFKIEDAKEIIELLDENGHEVYLDSWAIDKIYTKSGLGEWERGDQYPVHWDSLRRKCYAKDDYTCQNCGDEDTELHAHHQTPVAEGGEHTLDNLTTLCKSCHEDHHGFSI